jgi:hypothetical protein
MLRLLSFVPNAFVLSVTGLLCFPLFLFLGPNFEQPRSEARISQAYNQVRQIANSDSDIPDNDPWGQPYEIIAVSEHQIRGLSSGPNMSTPKSGFDDDIYSDMPVSPTAMIQARHNRQRLLAFAAAAGVWLFLIVVYKQLRRVDHD